MDTSRWNLARLIRERCTKGIYALDAQAKGARLTELQKRHIAELDAVLDACPFVGKAEKAAKDIKAMPPKAKGEPQNVKEGREKHEKLIQEVATLLKA